MHSVKAFRGTKRSSIYRELVLEDDEFERIVEAAGLGSLEGQLDKDEARRLAEQLTELRASVLLPELDDQLTTIVELARWCSRATDEAWLRIEPRGSA